MSETKKTKKEDADFVIDEKGEPEEAEMPKEAKPTKSIAVNGESKWKRFLGWYKTNKKKSIPLTLVLLIGVLTFIPWSRYQLAALALKNNYNLEIIDSTTGTSVSGATVSIGGVSATTDSDGKVTLHNVAVGHNKILVAKKYYKSEKRDLLVPILKQKSTPTIKVSATGRQVKINVKNLINHKPLSDVTINVSDVTSKTDSSGSAVIVLPVGAQNVKGALSLDGFNNTDITVAVDNKSVKENNYTLTPTGKVYFLSKLSGKIDVVKTNLDGSGRETVLAGTGKEDSNNTVLLASRDWKYLALLSKRDGGTNPKLFVINTSNDSMLAMDNIADASFNPVGWSNHNFIFTANKYNAPQWQPNRSSLKSYNAESGKVILLDQTKADGNNAADFVNENIGSVYQIGDKVLFEKYWSGYSSKFSGKQGGIYSASANGGSVQTLKTFDYEFMKNSSISSIPDEVSKVYYNIVEKDADPSYYVYENGKVSAKKDIKDDFDKYYQQGATTYLQSPSGSNTFWSESRDGKNTLFIGDQNGDNGKQIASLADYKPYGWFSDDYLLISKNSSELYIMSTSGINEKLQPIKVTDYHKPAQNFYGYGGGYGGV
jgi:hypothetical protein